MKFIYFYFATKLQKWKIDFELLNFTENYY